MNVCTCIPPSKALALLESPHCIPPDVSQEDVELFAR